LTLDNVAKPAGTTSISAPALSNSVHTITQTFYYKGNPIPNGSRSGQVQAFGGNWGIATESFAELTLVLSKPRD